MGLQQILPLLVKVDLAVMAMKMFCTFPNTPDAVKCYIQDTSLRKNKFQVIIVVFGFGQPISLVVVFANGPGDRGSICGRVIPKTQKVVLDTSLLNTQYYKVHFRGKGE